MGLFLLGLAMGYFEPAIAAEKIFFIQERTAHLAPRRGILGPWQVDDRRHVVGRWCLIVGGGGEFAHGVRGGDLVSW